jgi:ssDNA-binding Zn-finger/Zn-ribbon topoisomerase 1
MTEKHEFQVGCQKILEGAWHILKGFIITTLGALWHSLKSLRTDFLKSKDWYGKAGVLLAIGIIIWITWNSVTDIYWSGYRRLHSDWYADHYRSIAAQEAADFFDLYSQKFIERDCDFMRKVGADEAMYDKYGRTEYEKGFYDCNNYYKGINAKYYLPIEVEAIIESANKRRIRGKAIVLRVMEDGRHIASAQYFELWKVRDWELWHFNASSRNGSPKIPLETTTEL